MTEIGIHTDINKYTCKWIKEKALLHNRMPTNICRQNSGSRKITFGSYYSRVGSYSIHQWILSLVGGGLMGNRILASVFPQKILINYKRKWWLSSEEIWWHHLDQVIKVSIISDWLGWHHVPPTVIHWKEHSIICFCVVLLPRILESRHEQTSKGSKLRDILNNQRPVLFKTVKVMKDRQRVRKHSRLKQTKETW